MADLLMDFKTYFIAAGLVTDASCWLDTMPDTPDSSVAIHEYPGHVGLPQVASVSRSIQIEVRDLKGESARQKALALYNTLVTEDGIINLTPTRWGVIALRQTPFRLKLDDSGRAHYAFNLGIRTYTD